MTTALESGKQAWVTGELREAVRWVHRAADAAEAAGDDGRALALASAAADLMSALEGLASSTIPPRDEAAALAPFDDFNDQTIVDSPAMMVARQTAQGPVSIEDRSNRPIAPVRDPSPTQRVRSRTTLRVAVGPTASADGALNVVVLPDGSAVPSGMTEALLVVLDPDARIPVRYERA